MMKKLFRIVLISLMLFTTVLLAIVFFADKPLDDIWCYEINFALYIIFLIPTLSFETALYRCLLYFWFEDYKTKFKNFCNILSVLLIIIMLFELFYCIHNFSKWRELAILISFVCSVIVRGLCHIQDKKF